MTVDSTDVIGGRGSKSNKFCRSTDLSNKASVESFFVLRLLADLCYKNGEIMTKNSIETLSVPRGRVREPYKPDFVLKVSGKPRWLIGAKSVSERIEGYTYQCTGYAPLINRKFDDNPLQHYVLTNGLLTRVYVWDQEEPVLSLRFADFADGNSRYETLKQMFDAKMMRGESGTEAPRDSGHVMERPDMDVIKKVFARCHNIIWKAEKISPQAAFVEFAKLLFVKLWEDRKIRDDPQLLGLIGCGEPLPQHKVRFSTNWIATQESVTPNPIKRLFQQLADSLEQEIAQRRRKRIFGEREELALSPSTAKRVVSKLEHFYLFGIDEDLNGRMFETFLTATMRNRELGQYFTPRSVVKLMTQLAGLYAGRKRTDMVIDGCCGTGGFLIDAMTVMRQQVYDNTSLSDNEREQILNHIANEAIFGIDAGKKPAIAKIARINMYLHGDGGSKVYQTDALRPIPEPDETDTVEVQDDVRELAKLLSQTGNGFDVCLTNPPFSMTYSSSIPDERDILQSYELFQLVGNRYKTLRSSVMFIEKYWNLLKPGGRLLMVIDDSVLANKRWAFVRDFIRSRFIIKAIIGIHGDAFRSPGARVKTSIMYLTRRNSEDEEQPAAFVFESRYIGRDDMVSKTPPSVARGMREKAVKEINEIVAAFCEYGRGMNGPWLVGPESLVDRLDAKFLRPWSTTELVTAWTEAGAQSVMLSEIVNPVTTQKRLIPDREYTFIRVTYDGECTRGETRLGREVTYSTVGTASSGDLVVSNMNAVHRAIGVMQDEMEELLISSEYTILRVRPDVDVDQMYLWSVLRSAAIVAEWLSNASGLARHRVDWNVLRRQRIPLLPYAEQLRIGNIHRDAIRHRIASQNLAESAIKSLESLHLEGEKALDKLERSKPPR